MTIEWPKVYFGKSGWTFTAVLDGRLIERNLSKRDALGLAASIMSAAQEESKPAELAEWDRRVAC
jgi:hypothetical protein